MFYFSSIHKKRIIKYIRYTYVNIRLAVCPLICSFKSTGTLIFEFAITGTGALATAIEITALLIQLYCSTQFL